MKIQYVTPEYVEQFPEHLDEGILYICEEFDVTAHKCCCGCGEDVYNKLSPARWRLIKMPDGRISLEPSVGNWKYSCQSHYWIRNNRVIDAGQMSARAIRAVQQRDVRDRDKHIAHVKAHSDADEEQIMTLWGRVRVLFTRTLHRLKAPWPW